MAFEKAILKIGGIAAEDMSDYQYCFVMRDTTTGYARLLNSADEISDYGVLQDDPEADGGVDVMVDGYTKITAGEALAIGDFVKAEYISATDNGKAVNAAGDMNKARGIVVSPADAEDELATIKLLPPGTAGAGSIKFSVPLSALTANSTVIDGVYAVSRAMKITRASIAVQTIPVDADGVCTLALTNYDSSATADDNLLSAATFDLEGITAAKTAQNLSLTATAADLILGAGDYIYASLVNDSAAIDTNMAGGVLTIEADLI